ncbi:hypothetical protein BJG92_02887 [Arthrobacter sp. SO5]|uniref:hypothetical protein n=1 Tax=Arthrobacter sp. SO5 TaxID=1897055 RepID=UPI001E426EC2|nr:hypothetical protein [Arthrobacter sp. SO5]MCB5275339.1 hypothetical protein [Arthrobacter sp. SO5]
MALPWYAVLTLPVLFDAAGRRQGDEGLISVDGPRGRHTRAWPEPQDLSGWKAPATMA